MMNRHNSRPSAALSGLGALLAVYLLAPVALFCLWRLPQSGIHLTDDRLLSALATSAGAATISAAVIALFGIPLAYVLAYARGRLARVIGIAIQLPLALPPLISGILLIHVVGPYTPLGRLFDGRLTGSLAGIVLAQTFVAAPFLIIAARSAFAAIEPELPAVAATLGHGRLARFFRVALPIAAPGIQAGLLLSWLRAFGEFGATVILAYHPYSLPVYAFVQFSGTGLPATRMPVAAALLAAFIVLVLGSGAVKRRRRPLARLPQPVTPAVGPAPRLRLDLNVRTGTFGLRLKHAAQSRHLAILGPSGAGKTLTLKTLTGLVGDGRGDVAADDKPLHRLPPERRGIGYVPQHSALLPGRDVWSQITFGVGAEPGVASYWLERLHLDGLEARFPDELSGGQQRRTALARALACQPDILLLDEPFSALDAPVRDRLRRELRQLQQDTGLTTVLVTHDPEEAALLADEILVLDRGQLLQAGPRRTVFTRPNSPHVARLLGIRNRGSARVSAPNEIETDEVSIRVGRQTLAVGTPVAWSIRAEQIVIDENGPYQARVLDHVDLGSQHEALVQIGGNLELTLHALHLDPLTVGDHCRLRIPPDAVRIWPEREDDDG